MKRTWRPIRLCLAALIFFAIWCAWYFWPLSPRWTTPSEEIVGFDLQKQLLYTVPRKKEAKTELHGYDLASGTLRTRVEIETAIPRTEAYRAWLLSPDGTKVVCCAQMDWNLDVFDVATGKRVRRWTPAELNREWAYHAINFTPNSRQLLVQAWATTLILDIDSGDVRERFDFPEYKKGSREVHSIRTASEILLSPDERYLAASVDSSCSLVIDLQRKQVVGSSPFLAAARFSADAKLVRFISVPGWSRFAPHIDFGEPLPVTGRYMELARTGGNWVKSPHIAEGEGEFLASCDQGYATFRYDPVKFPILDHLPQWLQGWLLGQLGDNYELQVHIRGDQNELLRRFRCRIPAERAVKFDGTSVAFALSQDGIHLVFHDGNDLAVWDTRSPRPWTLWTLVLVFASFALWIAWPRRVHTSALPPESPLA